MYLASSGNILKADRVMSSDYAVPSLLLMETAGRRSAEIILNYYPDTHKFMVLCGPGNNGADGMVTARYLYRAGRFVEVVFSHNPSEFEGDAEINFQILKRAGIPFRVFDEEYRMNLQKNVSDTIIVDALLGTGAKEVREPIKGMINAFRGIPNSVIAIDLPSGLIADSGFVVFPPLRAELSIAFQLPKVCHYVTPASGFCGEVKTVDIGIYQHVIEKMNIPNQLITDIMVQGWYKPRSMDTHKGVYGHVYLAGGSKGMAGSIAMAAQACMEVGAGLCTAFIPGSAACAFHRTTLENMSIPYGSLSNAYLSEAAADVFISYLEKKSAIGIGPGLGVNHDTCAFLRKVLPVIREIGLPMVLDADALNILSEHPDLWNFLPESTILTPHPGEMAKLLKCNDIQAKRHEYAVQLATDKGVHVILKGAGSIIATPEGHTWVSPSSNAGMATAGSGDVLTGVITGLLAQGYSSKVAAVMGVFLHAKAGEQATFMHGVEGVTALKILKNLSQMLNESVAGKRSTIPARDFAR